MANSNDSDGALLSMCKSAIDGIGDAKGTRACQAHDPMAHGITALLQCKVAELARKRAFGMIIAREVVRAAVYAGLVLIGLLRLSK